jgi:SAM-dependent methyltransferase
MSYSYFSGVYDSLTENVDYEKIANVICSLLRKYGVNEGLLLDNACGTGTLSVLLSRAGYDVIGADKSSEMLSVAVKKAADANCRILFLNQDMLSLDLYGTIKACVCTLDGINHLDGIDEVKTAFEKIALFTEAGGIFIFDANTVFKHRKVLADNTFVYDLESTFCVWQNETDGDRVNINLDFFTDAGNGLWERSSESFSETAYETGTLTKALNAAGFSVLEVLDGYSSLPLNESSERAVFVCRKEM